MNRDKTERSIFEDAIGCVCETAYQDMVATKKRYHKMDGVQGFHLVQSFAKGKSPQSWPTGSAWSWQKGSCRENTKQ